MSLSAGAKKLMPPRTGLSGTLIRLSGTFEHLGIAEGIETALAATALKGVPCWASATAGLMESAEFPQEVQKVTIFGDNDKSFAGHKAAYALAHKLALRGIEVELEFPDVVGQDFADEVAI
jgi:putative DNA primase/helicase